MSDGTDKARERSPKPGAAECLPLRRAVDLDVAETARVELCNGDSVQVQVLAVEERADTVSGAIREVRVRLRVDDHEVCMPSGNYQLPITVGPVQVDCPIVKNYYRNTSSDWWRLEKDARLRLWPAGSPWIDPGSFMYPAKQRWFASDTQMANEPCYVDMEHGNRARENIYYHCQLDIGGAEGLTEVVCAADAVVLVRGEETREDAVSTFRCQPRKDRVFLLDDRGWVHIYSHLQQIAEQIQVGARMRQGDALGLLGKEGSSGGWAHLHYGVRTRQPSGEWGTEEGYAYLWQAYLQEYDPPVIAVARPHHLVKTGERVAFDGSRSWAKDGAISSYRWTFSDGSSADGPRAERVYHERGEFSEALRVTDSSGNHSYDFAVVEVFEAESRKAPPGIHASYAPTLGIKAGDPVTFAVRCFNTNHGEATWDFGDGSPAVSVTSVPVKADISNAHAPDGYALTTHRYARPGSYLVHVEHVGGAGAKAMAHLYVQVGEA